MKHGCRTGMRHVLGVIVFMTAFTLFILTSSADAFVDLRIDGRPIQSAAALAPLDNGVGIAVPLLQSELGFAVDEADWPTVVLRFGTRTARVVVDGVEAELDGRATVLGAPPRMQEETLFVPISLVTDMARFRMDLDLFQGVLTLTSRNGQSRPVTIGTEDPAPTVVERETSDDEDAGAKHPSEMALKDESAAEPPAPDRPSETSFVPTPSVAGDQASVGGDESSTASVVVHEAASPKSSPRDALPPDISAPEASPDDVVVVTDVRTVHRDGHVYIEVLTDGPVTPQVVLLDNPARLVIDVDGAVSATGWQRSPGDGRIVEQVRLNGGQAGSVRIVADLFRATGYAVDPEQAGFALRLNHPLQLLEATGSDGAGGAGIVLDMAATGPVPYRMFPLREPDRVVIDLFGVSIPGAEEVRLDGDWAETFRLSQFQQDAVRGVFVLHPDAHLPLEPTEGVLQPGPDGKMRLTVAAEGLSTPVAEEPTGPGNTLQFVGFGRTGDLEYILIRADEPLEVDVLRLGGPDRLVLDIPGLFVDRSLGLVPEDSHIVKAVRAGQAEDASARIVAETFGVAEHYLLLSPDRTRAVIGLRPSGLGGRTVVVDAGHGGKDPGAIGHSGSYEKDVTLSIALQVASLLGEAGANVVLTRDRDVELTLAERAQMANALRADAFVSIHADAIGFGRIASGTSTFYHPENGTSSDTSVNRQYALTLQNELLQKLGLPDRGVHERRFHVVLNTRMPAALVEVGFIDNPDEEQLLLDSEFQAEAAAGIAQGILRFFGEQDVPSPDQVQQWRARTERAAGLWLVLGIVPGGVSALEPTPLFSVAQTESRTAPETEFDVTRSP